MHLKSYLSEYFTYRILTKLELATKPQRLPSVGVCPSTHRGSLMKKLQKHHMSVRYNMTPGYSEYFKSCVLTLPSSVQVDCTDVTEPTVYIGPIGKCFTFFRSDYLKVNASSLVYNRPDEVNRKQLTIVIDSPLKENYRWFVRAYWPDEPMVLDRRDISKQCFEPSLHDSVQIRLEYTVKHRLPPPYHDGCYDYSKTPHKTRYKAIENCISRNYKNQTTGQGYWALYSQIEYGKEFVNESEHYLQESFLQMKTIFPLWIHKCTIKYPRNACQSHNYDLVFAGTRSGPRNNTRAVINFLNLPYKHLVVTFQPVSSILDFVNTVGGIVSLWIGAALFTWFTMALDKVLTKSTPNPIESKEHISEKLFRKNSHPKNYQMTRFVKFLMVIFCTLGCTLQSVDIGKIYIENNFYTWVSGVEPEKIDIPKLTLCIDRIFWPKKVEKLHEKLFKEVPPEQWSQHLSLEEMFDLTIDLKDILIENDSFSESCYVSAATRLTPILQDYEFDKQLTNKYVCFSTFAPENYIGATPLKRHTFAEITPLFFFILYFKKLTHNYTSEFKLFLHLGESFPMDESYPSYATIKNQGERLTPNLFYFSLNEVRQILVPDSYASKCFVYERINFTSREDALQACVRKFMKEKYKLWPIDTPLSRGEGIGLQFANESNEEQMHEAKDFCNSKFPLANCDSRYISLRVVDKGFHKSYTQLILYPPPDAYTEIRQELRFTISDLMVYIGSNINSWLGLAMVDVMSVFKVGKLLTGSDQ